MMKEADKSVLQRVKSIGVVPLFSHNDPKTSCEILEVCYKGGLTVFEYTNRQSNSFEIFGELVKYKDRLPGFMLGIGTVMDGKTTKKFIDAGAEFIISPIMKKEMGEVCAKHNIPWIPGCATLTEIVEAMDHGATLVKVFPGSILGPKFVSSVRPVIPNVPLMITGGVEPTEENFKLWFDAGATCLGLGSNLFSKDILESRDYARLETRARDIVAIASRVRS